MMLIVWLFGIIWKELRIFDYRKYDLMCYNMRKFEWSRKCVEGILTRQQSKPLKSLSRDQCKLQAAEKVQIVNMLVDIVSISRVHFVNDNGSEIVVKTKQTLSVKCIMFFSFLNEGMQCTDIDCSVITILVLLRTHWNVQNAYVHVDNQNFPRYKTANTQLSENRWPCRKFANQIVQCDDLVMPVMVKKHWSLTFSQYCYKQQTCLRSDNIA